MKPRWSRRHSNVRGMRFARKRDREGDRDLGAVGPQARALEMERIGGGDSGSAERGGGGGGGIGAFQEQEREPFAARQERLREAAELGREAVAAKLVRLRHREQLDEKAGELDVAFVRPPRMGVARTPTVKPSRR